MKNLFLVSVILFAHSSWGADAGSSDKFAQVRGFKMEISGKESSSVSASSALAVLRKSPTNKKLEDVLLTMPPMIVFKTLPLNGQISLGVGQTLTEGESLVLTFPVDNGDPVIEDVLMFKKVSGGLEISASRVITAREAGSGLATGRRLSVPNSPLDIQAFEQSVITAREAGSGLATGRRSSSVVCQGEECLLSKEILDLRPLLRKMLYGKEGSRIRVSRSALIAGAYPEVLVKASGLLAKLSSASIVIEGQELLKFTFGEEEEESMVANPLYQSSGNSGDNPLFESRSSLVVTPIFNDQTSLGGELRCSNGKKKENNLCGTTDHL
jgi:hypothetical protein